MQRRLRIPVLLAATLLALAAVPSSPLAQPANPGPAPASDGDAAGDGAADGDAASADAADAGDAAGDAAAAPDQEVLDIDALRQEYLRLRDELFRSRARAAAVASALYSTRLRVHLDYESARFYAVTRATIRLDGANVFDDTGSAVGTDKAPRFEGYVAPGRHRLSIRIEATGKDDERFTSVIDNTFTIQAPAGKDVVIRARAKDGGDIPYAWEKKQRGTYGLHLDVAVEAVPRAEAADQTARAGK